MIADCCWKNQKHPGICQSLHIKVIASTKLPTVSSWSVRSWVLCDQFPVKLEKVPANHLFESISGSRATHWNFQSVQMHGQICRTRWWKKRQGQHAEFQDRIGKEWSCLHCGGGSHTSFRFHCHAVFKSDLPDSDKSMLDKALIVPKWTSSSPRHAAGAHWHG